MNSKRLKAITKYVNKEDIVLDVGCDHGYLDIYLKENNLCKEVYACDISKNALEVAIKNFTNKKLKIESFLSDGFKNIPVQFNTAVIAGVGTNTIIDILNYKKPNKLILISNNELEKLRKYLNEHGYEIINEEVVYEKKHYYVIIVCAIGFQKLNDFELKFGISNNKDYYKYLFNKYNNIINKVTGSKKIEIITACDYLKSVIEKK